MFLEFEFLATKESDPVQHQNELSLQSEVPELRAFVAGEGDQNAAFAAYLPFLPHYANLEFALRLRNRPSSHSIEIVGKKPLTTLA